MAVCEHLFAKFVHDNLYCSVTLEPEFQWEGGDCGLAVRDSRDCFFNVAWMHSRKLNLIKQQNRAAFLLALGCLIHLTQSTSYGGDAAVSPVVTFESDVQPLLTRYGCNMGACHGKSRGQNGFALSLLGFDSDFDYAALVREGRGRRISASAPEDSLLLRKATGLLPHGGGKRIEVGSQPYQEIAEWIRSGALRTPAESPKLVRVVVEPANVSLAPRQQEQLQVIAEYSNGHRRNVTDGAAFQSNDRMIADILPSGDGLVRAGALPGEAAIMVRYMNFIAVCSISIPLPGVVDEAAYEQLPRTSAIDGLVWKKLKRLGMLPSPAANDSTIHRRAYLRTIGRLPTPDETRAYLADTSPNKRQALIDQLLERPDYADFWANKWADLLRPNPFRVGIKSVWNLHVWLREAFRKNMPYDQFARELLTAQGSTWKNGAVVVFRDRPEPNEIASSVSQIFLGIRLECAKCHHHPFEVWSQDDFFGFASFFSRIGHKGEGLSPPISGGEEMIFTSASGQLTHGRTGAAVAPKTLTGASLTIGPEDDPREVLVSWMTESSNPYFSRVMANRVWAEIMGQGLVEPVDDIRATNPPTNEPLLDYLAENFRQQGYDVKKLIRTIMNSYVFGLSSTPVERNIPDTKNFSRYYRQRMRAEVLLDAVNDVLGTEEEIAALPPGSRAMQLWTHRSSSIFLDTFGRPDPNQDPPTERSSESTTPQVLHLMNSTSLNRKLSLDSSRPAKLAESDLTNESIIDEAYLFAYSRFPTSEEKTAALEFLPERSMRRKGVEDLFWALLNTPEFSYVD